MKVLYSCLEMSEVWLAEAHVRLKDSAYAQLLQDSRWANLFPLVYIEPTDRALLKNTKKNGAVEIGFGPQSTTKRMTRMAGSYVIVIPLHCVRAAAAWEKYYDAYQSEQNDQIAPGIRIHYGMKNGFSLVFGGHGVTFRQPIGGKDLVQNVKDAVVGLFRPREKPVELDDGQKLPETSEAADGPAPPPPQAKPPKVNPNKANLISALKNLGFKAVSAEAAADRACDECGTLADLNTILVAALRAPKA